MAFSFGFYNSLNGDRKYDSEDLSRMFDGVITDGVLGSVGNTFAVNVSSGNTVTVASGRAWFNHTWSYNDAPMPVDCGEAEVLLGRYDAIVLEIDASSGSRKNSIKVIHGTAASNPVKPTLENSEYVHQYPFAYIFRTAGATEITQGNIENVVGTSECPLCTGPLTTMAFDQIIAQWQAQFEKWFADTQTTLSGDVAGNLLTKINAVDTKANGISNVYYATLLADAWGGTNSTDSANGLLYWQTAQLSCRNANAPTVSADSVFLSGVGFDPTGVVDTDDLLDEVLNIINKGKTTSGPNCVYVFVREKPTTDITARWEIQA